MTGMGPLTTAKINGTDVKFLVDSGAFWSIISPASAAELKLPTHFAPYGFYTVGVGGARADMSLTKVKELTLAGHPFHDIDFLVGGVRSTLSIQECSARMCCSSPRRTLNTTSAKASFV